MGFRKFLNKILNASKAPRRHIVSENSAYFEEPTGYYTVRGDEFNNAYAEWLNIKTLSRDVVEALGPQAFIANLDNRSGYVREFCLRAIDLCDWQEAFKPVVQRLNDYVPSNRGFALQLTLRWGAELPLAAVIDALPELDALTEQSRANSSAVQEALGQRLGKEGSQEALILGLTHTRAMVRRACWMRCMQTLEWSGPERIQAAMRCGDPSIARSVEPDVFALSDNELLEWFHKLQQVRAMPLRRAFLVTMGRRALVDSEKLISLALWDDSFSVRWLGRHWGKGDPRDLIRRYEDVLNDGNARRKRYALEGLAELKMPEGLDACKNALGDASPAIRKAALVAACAIDTDRQSLYVAKAMQDASFSVVRETFKLLIGLSLPLPLDAISNVANARREELPFFHLMLDSARGIGIWKALHLASFSALAEPTLQLKLAPAISNFLNELRVVEVYVGPSKQQWQAICAWMPIGTLAPNSGLRHVLDFYAKQMND